MIFIQLYQSSTSPADAIAPVHTLGLAALLKDGLQVHHGSISHGHATLVPLSSCPGGQVGIRKST